jgi:hypothetical protein
MTYTASNDGVTSAKKIAANRRNAEQSTGPVTDYGKGISRLNALKHGLTAETPVLPWEDEEDREDFGVAVHAALRPVGAYEEELVDSIVSVLWRLRRVERVETTLLAYHLIEVHMSDGLSAFEPLVIPKKVEPRPTVVVEEAQRMGGLGTAMFGEQLVVEEENISFGRAFLRDIAGGAGLAHLDRHESGLVRNLQRLTDQLYQSQDRR